MILYVWQVVGKRKDTCQVFFRFFCETRELERESKLSVRGVCPRALRQRDWGGGIHLMRTPPANELILSARRLARDLQRRYNQPNRSSRQRLRRLRHRR